MQRLSSEQHSKFIIQSMLQWANADDLRPRKPDFLLPGIFAIGRPSNQTETLDKN
jgi:hypothetical protein